MTDGHSLVNHLEIYKDHDPRTKQIGPSSDRILLYTADCEGGYSSFTVDKLNTMFEQGDSYFEGGLDDRKIMPRAVSLFEGLQAGYHSGTYPGDMNKYKHAQTEYPGRYEAIVLGLSHQTLKNISDMRDFSITREPDNLGESFVRELLIDRIHLIHKPQYEQLGYRQVVALEM